MSIDPTTVFYNVKDYSAVGNGTTDDTAAIASTLTAASANGGIVFFPPGTYLTGTQTLLTNVTLAGAGPSATVLKLRNGANADLLSANTSLINIGAAYGASSTGGIFRWGIRNMTLDGNRANQTSGTSWCLRVYGYAYLLNNVVLRNGYSGGMQCDWNGGGSAPAPNTDFGATILNCEWYNCGGIGLQYAGPSDSRIIASNSHENTSHGFHLGPNAVGSLISGSHAWGSSSGNNAVAWLIEADDLQWNGNIAEGADGPNVVLLCNKGNYYGRIFHSTSGSWVGLQLGQTQGGTPFPGSVAQTNGVANGVIASHNRIDGTFEECRGGAINFVNEASTFIEARVYQTAGAYYTGTPANTDTLHIAAAGLTPDGTLPKSGFQHLVSNAFTGFQVSRTDGTALFNVDTYDGTIGLYNNASFALFSDAGNTTTVQIHNGTIAIAQSSSAPDPGANGSVTTSGVGMARLNPSGGSRAGCILLAGNDPGQEVWVVNEHA